MTYYLVFDPYAGGWAVMSVDEFGTANMVAGHSLELELVMAQACAVIGRKLSIKLGVLE